MMGYEDCKDLTTRTASNKMLHDKAFNTAKNSKYDRSQRGLASKVYKFFDEKLLGAVLKLRICQTGN